MARSSELNELMRRRRKENILQVALQQFTRKGLFATKVKDIAEEAGMAQGLIYHYYNSKVDIYVELINNALDKMEEAVTMLKESPLSPADKIKQAVINLMETIKTSDDFVQTCRLIAQATNTTAIPEEAKELIEMKRDKPYQAIAQIIAEGQKDKTIVNADPIQLAILFWTTINGLAIYVATRGEQHDLPEAKIIYNIFLEGV